MWSEVYETVGRPSVCLSVRPTIRMPGLLLSAVWAGDIDRQQRPDDSKCE